MAKRMQYRRLLLCAALLAVAFCGLGYRLVNLQVMRHDELGKVAQQNTQRKFFLEPRRGDILDAKGNILATSVLMKNVCADPSLLASRRAEVAHAIAPLLQMSEADLNQKLLPRVRKNEKGESVTNQYVRLVRRVPVETWQKIQTAMTNLDFGMDGKAEKKLPQAERTLCRAIREKSIFAEDEQMRTYPNQELAAQVLGYATSEDKQMPDGRSVCDIVGRDGIEFVLNSKLNGVRGWRSTETDHRGREVVSLRDQDVEARDGMNVVLTIDSYIQHVLESALADAMEKHRPISVSGIVARPRTGEILAMSTLPTYNPNQPSSVTPERRNRVITDVVEPGSTFKIVVVSGALNDNVVTLNDQFDCENGVFAFAGRRLHDHEPSGVLTVKRIITKSSNIGAAKIGIKLGEDKLYDYITSYGFGTRTGLPLPGEVPGIVHPVKRWSKVSVAQIPMGQGIAVTRLQMMMAMCAIANNGVLMTPMLVSRLEDEDGNVVARYSPQRVRQVTSEDTAKKMVEALKTVVTKEGTAEKAAMTNYIVAGKTGTAQKVENGAYVHGKYIASFIGFFPADDPQLCISIVFDEPKDGYYGGQVAAPVFRQVAELAASYLNIPPDIDNRPKNEAVTQGATGGVAKVGDPQ